MSGLGRYDIKRGERIMSRKYVWLPLLAIMLIFSGCFANQTMNSDIKTNEQPQKKSENQAANAMKLTIGETAVPVTWEYNPSVEDLKNHLPLTIEMSKYGGFEQVGSIGRSIISDDKEITANYGDIVLYSGNKIVIFYGSNSWAYTRLGHINSSQREMTELLSKGNVRITIANK